MSRRRKISPRATKPVATTIAPPRTDPRLSICAALLAVAACALYLPSWSHAFVADDSFVIWNNAWTRQGLSALPQIVSHSLYFGSVPLNDGLYRPVAGAYYVVVGALTGLQPAGYHVAQILLYGLNAAIVFLFFARLTRRSIVLPVAATLLFIAHPIHSEVVNNIKSADEMLCLAFLLTSATAWLVYSDTAETRWLSIALLAYALALGSKETAVPMAIALPALWYFFRERSARASVVAALPFFALATLFVIVRQFVLGAEPQTAIVTLLNNALVATSDRATQIASAFAYLARYARMLFWPHPLSFDYSYNAVPLQSFSDPMVWVAVVLLAAMGAIAVWGWRRRRVEAFAVLWLAASMVVVSNLFFLVSTNFGERLLYLPSVFACYLVARLLFASAGIAESATLPIALRSPAVVAPLIVVLAGASAVVVARTREWRDESTLFDADVRKYPGSARLNNYRGSLYYIEGERLRSEKRDVEAAAAFAQAKAHLVRALATNPEVTETNAVLGLAEYHLKDCRSAIPHLERAILFSRYRAVGLEMMAECYEQLEEPAQALELYRRIDVEGIKYPKAWFALGNDAAARGDDDTSLTYFGKVIAVLPDHVAAYHNLAMAHYRKAAYPQALAAAEQCVARAPNQAGCLLIAADCLARTGRPDQAASYVARAKAADPNHPWLKRGAPIVK